MKNGVEKKIETAIHLLNSDQDRKYFQGLCLLMEVIEQSPENLDPLSQVLIKKVVSKLVSKIEKNLGVDVFEQAS
jgi:hypothetical protein